MFYQPVKMYQTIFCQHFVAESCIGLVKNPKIHNSCWKLKSPYRNLYLAKDLHLEEQGPVFSACKIPTYAHARLVAEALNGELREG